MMLHLLNLKIVIVHKFKHKILFDFKSQRCLSLQNFRENQSNALLLFAIERLEVIG